MQLGLKMDFSLEFDQLSTCFSEVMKPLGKPSFKKSAIFFNIVQKAFDPPLLSFEHYVVNFSEGILTKVSQQLSTKKHLNLW